VLYNDGTIVTLFPFAFSIGNIIAYHVSPWGYCEKDYHVYTFHNVIQLQEGAATLKRLESNCIINQQLRQQALEHDKKCSLDALECEGVEPDRILSFDSHIDTNLLRVLEGVLSIIHDNRSLRFAFTDGGTHALMTKAFPCTDIDIVTPRVCLEGNMALMQNRFPEIFDFSTETEAIREFLEFSQKAFNLNIKLSPPKDPVAFSSLLSSDSIVDIELHSRLPSS